MIFESKIRRALSRKSFSFNLVSISTIMVTVQKKAIFKIMLMLRVSTAPGPPTNVTAVMELNHSDTLRVTWIQPSSRCNITSNTISWSLNSTRVTATESYIITDLDPWTTYFVCVSASTEAGDGPNGTCIRQNTDEDSKLVKYFFWTWFTRSNENNCSHFYLIDRNSS